jgi:hypothetical protein
MILSLLTKIEANYKKYPMQDLYIKPTANTPEVQFYPEQNKLKISGISTPEDVRALYYPVIEWVQIFISKLTKGEYKRYTDDDPLIFQIDLSYFNSTSAKFFFDILMELKKAEQVNVPLKVEWYHDAEDIDMKDAGIDIAALAEMQFVYISK